MVTVIETWFLKEEFADKALQLMQEMDDIVGPNAHGDAGWCGHAQFFQRDEKPAEVIMMYPWRSTELHRSLRENEEPLLLDFVSTYCARERTVEYVTELEVEVEHDDHHHH
ncbi:hypothetical protein [Amycolatopsis sp. cg9]|uniref:hypothetical protein n=1 Tax=Amycolatopsis sp. cg9 TaxID=3238801 RepID=UPI0035235D9B